MECIHSVISMGHALHGCVELNGHTLDFSGGTGYIEADRGRSFPTAYLWTQCMWEGCSLMLSIATIPLGRFHFTGCICAMMCNGQEHRIATYRGAEIQKWSAQGTVIKQGSYRLEVQLLEQKAQQLRAPSDGNMNRTIPESLSAKVRYCFWREGELLFDHTATHAGYEYDQVTALHTEYEIEHGVPQCDVEFHHGGWEYDYEIHTDTEEILSYSKDD